MDWRETGEGSTGDKLEKERNLVKLGKGKHEEKEEGRGRIGDWVEEGGIEERMRVRYEGEPFPTP